MSSFAILIATYGDAFWEQLALERAVPSAVGQGAEEVLILHDPTGARHTIRNELAQQAKSDWLVFLDADDHLAGGFIDSLRRAVPTDDTVALLNPAVGHWRDPEDNACFAPKELHKGNYLIIGTAVPRQLFHQVGGFWDWPLFEDWELWIRCVKTGATVIQVPGAIYLIDSTERSKQGNCTTAESGRWLQEIRRHHWPEIYGQPRAKRTVQAQQNP